MTNCESCETIGIESKATTTRNGENVCDSCAADIDSRKARTAHICDECDTEFEGEFCETHPNASFSSIRVVSA